MLTKAEVERRLAQSVELFATAGMVLTEEEKRRVEIADFGLSRFEQTGLGVLVYVNTARVCAKELAMLPNQSCPEHRHPPAKGGPGKEETFRCRWGSVSIYVPGEPTKPARAKAPAGREKFYTVWHEIHLEPGQQYTMPPNTLHWFQSGARGAVVSEFSTTSVDEADIFTDPEIARFTKIVD